MKTFRFSFRQPKPLHQLSENPLKNRFNQLVGNSERRPCPAIVEETFRFRIWRSDYIDNRNQAPRK